MTNLRSITAAICLTLSLHAAAASADWKDHAIVVCRASNLQVTALSASYGTAASVGTWCADALKMLKIESMHITKTEATSDHIIYTLEFFQ